MIIVPTDKTYVKNSSSGERLISLDFYRGLIMVLLMLESSRLYDHLADGTKGSFAEPLMNQFFHHPWHGLHFWDLIQPGFMFIAGVAMAYSIYKQKLNNTPWKTQAGKALRRSGWLFFWGVLDYAVRGDHLSFELWDVLTQLSVTMLIAFFIFSWKTGYQILFSIGLLLLTELLYRNSNIPGFEQPFTDQHNFGNYVDMLLMHKINPGGWVAINCIPTAAHTIWGAVAGKWLLKLKSDKSRITRILVFGLVALVSGYILDFCHITPIIKRIATSSFVLVSGGYCLLGLAFLYGWIDMLGHKRYLKPFIIVGMNSIFIYVFFEIVVDRWLYGYLHTLVAGVLTPFSFPVLPVEILASGVVFAVEWGLCYWLYRRKIFFKL